MMIADILADIPGISVCIPARNEQKTIRQTVQSITDNYQGPSLEVIVAVSASTDHTAEIVERIGKKDKRVKLLQPRKKGKATAWNACVENAKYDDIVFGDGDVIVAPGSVANLVSYMHEHDLHAVTAKQKQIFPNLTQMLLHYPSTIPGFYLCGRLYSMQRPKVREAMREKGYSAMPADIINEDMWVSIVCENRDKKGNLMNAKWGYCRDAVVYFKVPTYSDEQIALKRMARGFVQLETEHPALNYSHKVAFIEQGIRYAKEYVSELDDPIEKILVPIISPLQNMIIGANWLRAFKFAYDAKKNKEPYNFVWKRVISSKTAFNKPFLREALSATVQAKNDYSGS